MIILIPAYQPGQQLPDLIRALRAAEPRAAVVVVDDGSGPAYKDVFDGVRALGCHVISYARNRGKGFALKAGFGLPSCWSKNRTPCSVAPRPCSTTSRRAGSFKSRSLGT